MVELQRLRVSLTKNGYMKIASLVTEHPSHEILEHVQGSHLDITLVKSQVANILCADPDTDAVPRLWDEVRVFHERHVRAFTFAAIIYSHYQLIQAFIDAGQGSPQGTMRRSELSTEKVYTNLAYAMSEVGVAPYSRASDQVSYDLSSLHDQLAPVGSHLGRLLKAKLRKCGWLNPDEHEHSQDLPLVQECLQQDFHQVLGLRSRQFDRLITGTPTQPR